MIADMGFQPGNRSGPVSIHLRCNPGELKLEQSLKGPFFTVLGALLGSFLPGHFWGGTILGATLGPLFYLVVTK